MPTFTAGTNKGQTFNTPEAWSEFQKSNQQYSQEEVNKLLGMGFTPSAFEQVDGQWYAPNTSAFKSILAGNNPWASSTLSMGPGAAPATSPSTLTAPSTSPAASPISPSPSATTPTPTMNFTPQNVTELAESNKFRNLYGDFGARRMGLV